MVDIMKCDNQECVQRFECFRWRAEASPYQSYMVFEGGFDCPHFVQYIRHDRPIK